MDKYAQDFAANENGEVTRNGKVIAYTHTHDCGTWTIWPQGDFSTAPTGFDPAMVEIAWVNVNVCGDCGSGCVPGSRQTVFGKEFDNLCAGAVLAFSNPDAEALECVKKLLEGAKC